MKWENGEKEREGEERRKALRSDLTHVQNNILGSYMGAVFVVSSVSNLESTPRD